MDVCGLCGKTVEDDSEAKIDDVRYCHGDDDPEPTCYMEAGALPVTGSVDFLRRAGVVADG